MCKYCEIDKISHEAKRKFRKNQRMTVSIVTNMFNEDMYYLNIKSTCGTGECININYCPVCRKKIRRTSMNKKIEEAIERLNNFKNITILYSNIVAMNVQELKQVQQDIETLVQALENSIPKEVVEEKILELNAKYPKGSTNDFIETEREHKVSVLQELLQEK